VTFAKALREAEQADANTGRPMFYEAGYMANKIIHATLPTNIIVVGRRLRVEEAARHS
jgi:hypothetical protein